MRTLKERLSKLETTRKPAHRTLHEYTDAMLERILCAAGINPNNAVELAAAARGEFP